MKTADLIPLLLIELNESDKYGFELTKNIETKSNGKIVIKQPTLYTLLKKLEKSKFITSYWQDSEIGGKRHYYKITDNGKLQLSTLPSYDVLLQNILANEENLESDTNQDDTVNQTQDPNAESIKKDELPSTPIETILPKEEVFGSDALDTSTTTEINTANAEILKSESETKGDSFATNIVVAKFVEVKPTPAPEVKPDQQTSSNFIVDLDCKPINNSSDIKFVDYVNLKKSKEYRKMKQCSSFALLKSIIVSLYILGLLTAFALLSKKFGTSPIYYVSIIIGAVIAIFYPILTSLNAEKIQKKFKTNSYKQNVKLSTYVKLSIFLLILLATVVINISLNINSFGKMFDINNFENFYAPILLSSSLIIDIVLKKLFSIKLNK